MNRNSYLLFICLCISVFVRAQDTGTLSGKISDASTMEPLIFANVTLIENNTGDVSDRDGKYKLLELPAGKHTLAFSYLGYKTQEISVEIIAGKNTELNIALEVDAILSGEIVVTAQALGQAAAINQQLGSNTIVNVVSKDRIESLPDQNAAESVGRLPGISVQRDGGEGTKVVVRGLSPKFNSITVNGERIPSTDPADRSVDLSMISADMLDGIEVFKALTPDKDGDAVGGTVNFTLKKADGDLEGKLKFQYGYNGLQNKFGQYKGSGSLGRRFFDNKLGLLLTGNLQKADRSSDAFGASYLFAGRQPDGEGIIEIENLNLRDRIETRYRFGGSLGLDYDLKNGAIMFNSLWSRTERDEVMRRRRYRLEGATQDHEIRERQVNTQLLTNALSGKHNIKKSKLTWRTSYSESKQTTPTKLRARFRETGAFTGDLITDQGPELIPMAAKNNIDETFFLKLTDDSELVTDRNFTAQADMDIPFQLENKINGHIKFGGKYKDKNRALDKTTFEMRASVLADIGTENPGVFELDRNDRILIGNFIDDYIAEDFLYGAYDFGPGAGDNKNGPGLDPGLIRQFSENYNDNYQLDPSTDLEDYKAGEQIYAGYIMATINIGDKLMLLPGLRTEQTNNKYKSIFGTPSRDENGESTGLENIIDTTGSQTYTDLLPMFHVRYKFTPWFDLRLAATRSLSRPDYFNLVPFQRVERDDGTVERGNPGLRHTKVWNYDIFFSFYNKTGLLTVGGFYKKLKDINYIRTTRVQSGSFQGLQLTEPVNGEGSTVYGAEIDLQANARFLPKPFDGIVLSANYSLIRSETFFPFFDVVRNPDPPFNLTVIDTTRKGNLPGQANYVGNFSLGYEKGGFSGRISLVLQGESLFTVGTRRELDAFMGSFSRWDIAIRQKIKNNIEVFINLNNISNAPDRAFLGTRDFLTSDEFFGREFNIGLKYKFVK